MSLPVRKNLKNRRAVVIGSDPGGLSAAISLAVRGARVVVLEKGNVLAPSMMPREVEGYRFEPWPPFITYPHIIAELLAGAGLRLTDFVTVDRAETAVSFHLGKGKDPFNVYTEREKTFAAVAERFPEDFPAFVRLMEKSEGLAESFDQFRRRYPFSPRLLASGSRALQKTTKRLPNSSLRRYIFQSISDQDLRRILLSLRALSGLSSHRHGVETLRVLADLVNEGGWYVENGMGALRAALLRVCQILNIKFLRNAAVERVELHGNGVRRVHGYGFSSIAATIMISNVGLLSTVRDLLPPSEESDALFKMAKSRSRTVPLSLTFRVGSNTSAPVLTPLSIVPSAFLDNEALSLDRWGLPPGHPTISIANHSAMFTGHAPKGHRSLSIRLEMPNSGKRFLWSEGNLIRYEEKISDRLHEVGLGTLFDTAIVRDAITPPEAEQRSSFSWGAGTVVPVATKAELTELVSNRFPGVGGLYMASGSVYPGAGLDNAILSGMMAGVMAAEDAG